MTIALDALLYRHYGAAGLALAFSSGAALQALFMGLFVYRASPRGAGVPVLVRWLATATVLAVALHFVPQPEGFIQLCLYIGLVLIGFAAGVMLLGERDLFKPATGPCARPEGRNGGKRLPHLPAINRTNERPLQMQRPLLCASCSTTQASIPIVLMQGPSSLPTSTRLPPAAVCAAP